MSMMKYMRKICVVLQAVVIPRDTPASISKYTQDSADVLGNVSSRDLHCEMETQHLHHAEAEQIHLYFYLHLFYYLLLLVTARYPLEMLFFITVLCT